MVDMIRFDLISVNRYHRESGPFLKQGWGVESSLVPGGGGRRERNTKGVGFRKGGLALGEFCSREG